MRARDVGGLPAAAAGVEHADLGVGEFGGRDVGHGASRHLLAELGRAGSAGCGGGLHTAASCTFAGRVSATVHTTAVTSHQEGHHENGGPGSCAA